MDIFNSFLQDPESVTFTLLFIGLFVYVMRTNEKREEHYRQTIELLTHSLNECEATKVAITNLPGIQK